MAQIIRICMLNADIPVPNVVANKAPTYGCIFHSLLSAAAERISQNISISSTDYDVRKGEYPISLSEYDVLLITGSANSAYDDEEWIRRLDQYVLDVYLNHPRIKIFGSCFGHQLMCQSLLRGYGVKVEKDTNGWELGVREMHLEERFRKTIGQGAKPLFREVYSGVVEEKMRLQFVHSDHVVIPSPEAIPKSWMTLGATQHCAVQGVYEPGRILTLQGHFEFDRFVNSETLKVFGAKWDPMVLEETLRAIDADDDSEPAAEMVLQFLLEKSTGTHAFVGGLLTPPLEE